MESPHGTATGTGTAEEISGSGILVEFLEVAISCIIYLKGLYPSGAFERSKYLKMVVHRARHPQLGHYIHSTLSALLPFLQKGLLDRVAVIFSNGNDIPVERFVFNLTINQFNGSLVGESELEDSLRSLLIKLPVSEPLTKVLPQDCRWEINAYFRSLPQGGANKESALWLPTDMKQWHQPPLITPIKSVNSNPFCVQLYLEHPGLSEPVDQNVALQLC